MKTSSLLASFLLGSLATAAPLKPRDLVTKTEVVVETVVVYTTVWDDAAPAAEATSTPGLFYERPSKPASSKAEPSSTAPAYTPPAPESSSVYTPPPVTTPSPEPTPTPTPTPEPQPEPSSVYTPEPQPEPSSVYTPPAPSSAAPAPSQPSSSPSQPSGEQFHGDITIYDNTGAAGACGKPITDGDMIVALAQSAWGQSTYDVQTGEATNPWCGKEITIEYNGNKVNAKIMDMCPGCSGHDIDLSLAAWKALTGLEEKTRLQADWWVSS